MKHIKHIFFDLDHTLWDFETNSNKTFAYIFQKNNMDVNFNDFNKAYEPINTKYWKLFREDKISKADLRYFRLKETFDALNLDIEDKVIDVLSEDYITYLSKYNTLFDGALELLEYLQPKYAMHIITNGFEEVQFKKIENSKLAPFFDQIITSEKVGVKKPNPKIFKYALKKAKAQANESIMIGDNFEADILGAKNMGMHTIFCKFTESIATEEVITVSNLNQIKKYL